MVFRQFLHQILLYLLRILILCKAQPVRYPFYVSVHHYAGLMIDVPPYDIGRLSSHSRKGRQFL